jgi:putative hemolysin
VWILETAVTKFMQLGRRHWQARIDEQMKSEAGELQELRASVALARTSRLIGVQEEKIILKAAALSQRPVREIMLPANAIRTLDVNASIADCLVAAHLDMHTRFPVTEMADDPQSIIGYVNFKDIVAHMKLSAQEPSIRAIVRTILSFAENTTVSYCLEELIKEHTHIALVRSLSGPVMGMVTLEDIIEELVGEIEDEYDRLPSHAVPSGIGWIVGGGIPLARLQELTKLDFTGALTASSEPKNLNEWVCGHHGKPLEGGEILERGEIRVVVRKVRRNKVLEAQVGRRKAALDQS